ncbi:MAG: single-stranded-DNA-specific exonuclease RecJ [Candidatus Coatesbacteria bacterium]|nr:MAG: single-stranded-DNA-specific exonuclease RecJ [Candidatus Coatesbacteria bacterium]
MKSVSDIPRTDERDVYRLAAELTVHPALARVLIARGITNVAAAQAFLNPTADDLGDPGKFPCVPEAADRILSTIDSGDRIFVAGDYDVDGLTGTALLVRTIRALGGEVDYFIPNRLEEGYDLSESTVRLAAEKGTQLLVTVDCGTRAIEPVALAKELGLDVVVTDHHRPAETQPDAPVVNPHYLPDGHPAENLSGAGISYKVASRLLAMRPATGLLDEDLLPLVALGTVCDVVPLTGENRTLARLGIESFQRTDLPGLKALLDTVRITDEKINSWHLAFIIGPRLNAAGRLGKAEAAAELLTTDDPGTAFRTALLLEDFNYKRRELEKRIFDEVTASIGAEPPNRMAVIAAADDWHPGVIGIVASRTVELYGRPAVLISFSGDVGRGSCRSIPAFDIHNALEETAELFVRFGGHRQAAGFEIHRDNYAEFETRFLEYADENLAPADLVPEMHLDAWMSLAEADASLCKDFAMLEPTGVGNPPPAMVSLAEVKPESLRVYKNEHLGFTAELGPSQVRAIGFRMARERNLGEETDYYTLIYTPNLDTWHGTEKMELRISAVEPAELPELDITIADMRGEPPDETVAANSGPDTAVFTYSTSTSVFPDSVMLVDETSAPTINKSFGRLILYAPPFCASLMGILSSLVRTGGTHIFAFGEKQVEEARDAIAALYPDKKLLGEIYRAVKRTGNLTDANELFHLAGVARAEDVFRELNLAETDGDRFVLKERDDIGRLKTSPTFNRCAGLREIGHNFIKNLAAWPGEKLGELVFSAINLDNRRAVS